MSLIWWQKHKVDNDMCWLLGVYWPPWGCDVQHLHFGSEKWGCGRWAKNCPSPYNQPTLGVVPVICHGSCGLVLRFFWVTLTTIWSDRPERRARETEEFFASNSSWFAGKKHASSEHEELKYDFLATSQELQMEFTHGFLWRFWRTNSRSFTSSRSTLPKCPQTYCHSAYPSIIKHGNGESHGVLNVKIIEA